MTSLSRTCQRTAPSTAPTVPLPSLALLVSLAQCLALGGARYLQGKCIKGAKKLGTCAEPPGTYPTPPKKVAISTVAAPSHIDGALDVVVVIAVDVVVVDVVVVVAVVAVMTWAFSRNS